LNEVKSGIVFGPAALPVPDFAALNPGYRLRARDRSTAEFAFSREPTAIFLRQLALEKHPCPVADRGRSIHCAVDAVSDP